MLKIEYSSMALTSQNYKKKIEEALSFLNKEKIKFGVQIHNSINKELFKKIMEYKDDIEFTVHSPIFTKYLINLADEDFDLIKDTSDQAVSYLKKLNTNIFFFHGFFMSNKKIKNDLSNYRKMLLNSISNEYRIGDSIVMRPEILKSNEYKNYKNTFKINFKKLKSLYPDLIIGIENDFPGLGSGCQKAEDIIECIDNLWFDTGHLWCSSILHNFDFYKKSEELIEKLNIIGVHINHNQTPRTSPPDKIYDTHTHLYSESEQKLEKIIKKLYKKGLENFTLEIREGDINDIKILLGWLI